MFYICLLHLKSPLLAPWHDSYSGTWPLNRVLMVKTDQVVGGGLSTSKAFTPAVSQRILETP